MAASVLITLYQVFHVKVQVVLCVCVCMCVCVCVCVCVCECFSHQFKETEHRQVK
jgi:hypothetical protein